MTRGFPSNSLPFLPPSLHSRERSPALRRELSNSERSGDAMRQSARPTGGRWAGGRGGLACRAHTRSLARKKCVIAIASEPIRRPRPSLRPSQSIEIDYPLLPPPPPPPRLHCTAAEHLPSVPPSVPPPVVRLFVEGNLLAVCTHIAWDLQLRLTHYHIMNAP